MSVAAQLATLPLTVFYFNQFPSYFLLANLAVIPIAGLILYLGIAIIVTQMVPPIAIIIGKLTFGITWLLNEFILRIQMLPHAVIHLPAFPLVDALLLSLTIILVSSYFISRRKPMLTSKLIMPCAIES